MMTKAFALCHLEIWKAKISINMTFYLANGNIKISAASIRSVYKTLKICPY